VRNADDAINANSENRSNKGGVKRKEIVGSQLRQNSSEGSGSLNMPANTEADEQSRRGTGDQDQLLQESDKEETHKLLVKHISNAHVNIRKT